MITRFHRAFGLLIVLVVTLVSGCATVEEQVQDKANGHVGELYDQHSAGQTFVARHSGLNRIDLLLANYSRHNTQDVTFHLRFDGQNEDLATIRFPAGEVGNDEWRGFTFSPIEGSQERAFYVFLESASSSLDDSITVLWNSSDVYSRGTAVLDGRPASGDLAFRVYYNYSWLSIVEDSASGAAGQIRVILFTGVLLVVPGLAVTRVLGLRGILGWTDCVVMSPIVTVAILPLVLLIASQLGISLSPEVLFGLVAVSFLIILAELSNVRVSRLIAVLRQVPDKMSRQLPITPALLLLTISLALVVRLLIVREIAAPLWADSYHYAVIAQLIADQGKLPSSYEPFMPVDSFTYHFGFSALAAFLSWVVEFDIPTSVLIIGQTINALSVLSVYLFAYRLTRSKTVGITAGMVVGLLAVMPAYYVNWGRYSQLLAQVILPLALVLFIEVVNREAMSRGLLTLASAVWAGLVVAHYRVMFVGIVFVIVFLAWRTTAAWTNSVLRKRLVFRVASMVVLVLVFVAPFVINLALNLWPRFVRTVSAYSNEYTAFSPVSTYLGNWLMVGAGLGAALDILRGRRRALLLVIWIGALFLVANIQSMGLPGRGILNNFVVTIGLFVPLSSLVGILASELLAVVEAHIPRCHLWFAVIFVGSAVLGTVSQLQILDYGNVFVRNADIAAINWVKENTPEDAVFLVNGDFFQPEASMGTDAGFWLPILAKRRTTVPPIIYSLEGSDEYFRTVNDLVAASSTPTKTESLNLFAKYGVTYLFIGERGGPIWPEEVLGSRHYELLFRSGDAFVFRIRYDGSAVRPFGEGAIAFSG